MKKKLSPITKRIIKHFLAGKKLSVRNMWEIRVSNISREVIRNFEQVFNIELDRKRIDWKDEYSSGYYFEYSIDKSKIEALREFV